MQSVNQLNLLQQDDQDAQVDSNKEQVIRDKIKFYAKMAFEQLEESIKHFRQCRVDLQGNTNYQKEKQKEILLNT